MRDWENLIREHLRDLELDEQRVEEIVSELAGHLEDVFTGSLRRGLSEAEAVRCALEEIPNWKNLRRRVRRAALQEGTMNKQAKCLWIPGLAMVAVSLVGLTGAFRANMYPEGLSFTDDYCLLIYVPWLASLPLIGALGAYWSSRTGANSATRLRACLIPVVVLTGMFLVSMPFTLFWVFKSVRTLGWDLRDIAYCALSWAVYPSLLLLMGALPFLKGGASETNRQLGVQN